MIRNTPKIYLWVIGALVVLNIGTLAALWLLPPRPPAEIETDDWLVQELVLTEEQQQAFDELRTAYMQKRRVIYREVRDLRRQMIDSMGKGEKPNRSAAEAFLPEIVEHKLQAEKLFLDHYHDLQKVCTAQQREKLQEIFIRMNRPRKRHDHQHKDRH